MLYSLKIFSERKGKENLNDSYNELKTQVNQIATFLQTQFGVSFPKENEAQAEGRILQELRAENEELRSQITQMSNEIFEMNYKIEKLFTHTQELHDRLMQEIMYLKQLSLDKLEQHFDKVEQTVEQNSIQIEHKCPIVSPEEFDGILKYLHQKGEVELKSGHKEFNDSRRVTNLIDYSNTQNTFYDACADQRTNWIEFNFLTRKIDLSSYQIKSYPYGSGGHHPRTWEIRGSNDQNNWDVLDRREDCLDLYARCITKHFTCQTPTHKHYQYIRFYQFDNRDENCPYNIMISRFELYGDIYNQ